MAVDLLLAIWILVQKVAEMLFHLVIQIEWSPLLEDDYWYTLFYKKIFYKKLRLRPDENQENGKRAGEASKNFQNK